MKIFRWLRQLLSDLAYDIKSRFAVLPHLVDYNVPYVCQFARPVDAERLIKKELKHASDPHWEQSGARSPEEYARWSRAVCGMAAAAMALEHFKKSKQKPVALALNALQHGVYQDDGRTISPLQYRAFARWIGRYGLRADVRARLSLSGIRWSLAHGLLPIVSVNPNIRGFVTSATKRRGGHLVLVTGYDQERRVLWLNNPSGFASLKSQQHHEISEADFRHFYAGRGLLISSAE